ncbi:hypothetical protein BH11MYX1_BH11MYX1_19080 [soil metagenome]
MPGMRRLLFLVCLGACAQAGKADSTGRPDSAITLGDSNTNPDAFVVPIDAPPGMMTKTLTQTTNEMLVQNTAPACGNSSGTDANSYYRVFDLGAAGITTDFKVTSVGFQVDYSTGQTATVRVGTYMGTPGTTLTTGNLTVVASNPTVTIPATTTGATVTAALTTATIAAGKKLFVELDSPAGATMYIGANTNGETAPGYIMSTACSIPNPTNISTVSSMYPTVDMLMTVTGTY